MAKLRDLLDQAERGEVIGAVANVRYENGRGCETFLMGETHYLEQIGQMEMAKADLIAKGIIYFSPLTMARELSTFAMPTTEIAQ